MALIITPQVDAAALLRRLKGVSARESNKLLGQTGRPFWQHESYDRLVRNANEFERIENYILQNPVPAGLARSVEGISMVEYHKANTVPYPANFAASASCLA